ncbi:J domain-containing protein [Streptomyces bathyalis]|uniref:J domain-containing protein n=1 Tax=Streptomyces bathyalis TaxID=2710756 RepID=A0A7T1T2G8_9ACTN|nr:hypothetical protein [Streptomyces bathyalis]QPP05176.1 J domain-containing protein [Streptomyces bathyalis]
MRPYATSLAYADTRGDGAVGREWLFGVPYAGDDGTLLPWCMHCGQPMVDPCSPGATRPYFDVAADESEPACSTGHDHFPVYIWTPWDSWYEVSHIDLDSRNQAAEQQGRPRRGPFDAGDLYDTQPQHQRHDRNQAEQARRHQRQTERYSALYRWAMRRPLSREAAHHILCELADAAPQERSIKQLQRAAALRWHPDREGGNEEVFQFAQEAYDVLDPPAHRCRSAAAPPQPTTGQHQARRR